MTESEWVASTCIQPMLTFLRRKGTKRKLLLFACACCQNVRHLLKDDRSRRALEVASCWAERTATEEDRDAASEAAQAACEEWSPHSDEWYAAQAAHHALRACYPEKVEAVADDAPLIYFQPYAAACEADNAILGDNSAQQVAILRDIFGNSFRPVTLDPAWLMPTVTSLAAAAYQERVLPSGELDAARLAVLADALEESGCQDANILGHLRSPGPHVRGCWPVDWLLGKE